MGALAGWGGRHRSRLAGAAVLTLALALAAPAAASRTLVQWSAGGGIAGGAGSELTVHRDHSAHAVQDGDEGSAGDFKLTGREWTRLRKRLKASHFRTLRAEYKAPLPVPDGTYESVRYRGHTVTVSTGGVPPGRLERLLTTLYRIYRHHAS